MPNNKIIFIKLATEGKAHKSEVALENWKLLYLAGTRLVWMILMSQYL